MKLIKRVYRVLDEKQKKKIIGLLLLMLVGAALETIGTGLILPLITAATSPGSVTGNRYMNAIYQTFHMTSVTDFLLLVVVLLIIVFIFKNVFLFFMYREQYRFVYNGQFSTSRRLFKEYVHRPYEYFLDASTPVVIRNIVSDVNGVYNLILTFLQLFTEGVVFLALFVLSLGISPIMTLLMSLFLGGVMVINKKVFGPILRRFGNDVQQNNALVTKWLMQAMNGMKETKVLNKEGYFISQYETSSGKLRDIQLKQNSLSNIPRLSIETVMMVGILSVFGIFLARDTKIGTGSMIGQLALLAMVAVRIMPSSNRIVQAINNIAYYEPSLTAVEDIIVHAHEIDVDSMYTQDDEEVKPFELKKELKLEGLTYRYPNTEVDILENADLTVPAGRSIGLIGPSGAGKSTTVDLLLGLLDPQKGRITVDGVDIRDNPRGWVATVGYVPQMMFMLDDSIRANVAYGVAPEKIDDEKVWACLKEAQMDEYVRKLPLGLDSSIGERGVRISGGQRQRIGIARALYNDPQVMIFDEATSALDNDTESAIMEAIEKLHGKKTLIIVAHRLTTIANCDEVYKVDEKQFIPQDMKDIHREVSEGTTIPFEEVRPYTVRRKQSDEK